MSINTTRRLGVWLLGLSAAGTGSVARAAGEEQGGIRSGMAVVEPALEFLGTWRSNVYLTETDEQAGFYFGLNPTLGLSLDAPEARLGMNAGYFARIYPKPELRNLNRFNDVALDTDFDLAPSGVVGLRTKFGYNVSSRPSEAEAASTAYLQKQDLDGQALVMIRPGSSLELGAGGFVQWLDYNTDENVSNIRSANLNNRLEYGPRVDFKWRFFPKTAVVGGYRYSWFYWKDNALWVDNQADWVRDYFTEVGDLLGIPDGRDTHAYFGVRGRFTEKLILGLVAGYAQLNYLEETVDADAANEIAQGFSLGPGYDADVKGFPQGLTANVEVGYQLAPRHNFLVGYRRDFRDIFFTNYVGYNDFFAQYSGELGDRVKANLNGGFRTEAYRGAYSRDDAFLRVAANLSYAAASYVDLRVGGWWNERASADREHPEIEYDDFGAFGGVKFHY